ncbi:MAG: nucleoside-triphosphatase [Petrotogales bacterium]
MKRFFLSGDRECGKSTLIKSIVDECKPDFEGFTTFFDHSRNHLLLKINKEDYYTIAERNEHGYMNANTRELQKAGKTISKVISGNKILIIDELGYIEQQSPEFMNEVEKILQNAKKCICVLRENDNPFLKRIKQLPDYETIKLTRNNREEVLRKLIRAICNKAGK